MNLLICYLKNWINTAIVFCFFFYGFCFGQSYQFKNYSVEDGLAQLEIGSISQDNFSNIWFGTNGGGVSIFDGIRFVNFTENDGLISDKVNYILKDNVGDMWVCTNKGISYIQGSSFQYGNNITPKFINYSVSSGLADENVWCAIQDKDGFIWFGTNDGLSKLKTKENQKEGNLFFNTKLGLSHQVVYSILQDSREVFWIGTKNGLTRYDQATSRGKSYQYYFQKNGLPNDSIFSLYEEMNYYKDKLEETIQDNNKKRFDLGNKTLEIINLKSKEDNYIKTIQDLNIKLQSKEDMEKHYRENLDSVTHWITTAPCDI